MALTVQTPDGNSTGVAVDAWTTCEEAAATAVIAAGIEQDSGWTLVLDDGGVMTGKDL